MHIMVSNYEDIERHVGHDIVCVTYGQDGEVFNIAIECETCNEVIIDFEASKKEWFV